MGRQGDPLLSSKPPSLLVHKRNSTTKLGGSSRCLAQKVVRNNSIVARKMTRSASRNAVVHISNSRLNSGVFSSATSAASGQANAVFAPRRTSLGSGLASASAFAGVVSPRSSSAYQNPLLLRLLKQNKTSVAIATPPLVNQAATSPKPTRGHTRDRSSDTPPHLPSRGAQQDEEEPCCNAMSEHMCCNSDLPPRKGLRPSLANEQPPPVRPLRRSAPLPYHRQESISHPFHRNESVSALTSLANMRLQSCTSLAHMADQQTGRNRRNSITSSALRRSRSRAQQNHNDLLLMRQSWSSTDSSGGKTAVAPPPSGSPKCVMGGPYDADQAMLSEDDASDVVEVTPGLQARFRGAQETWACIQRDFYLPTNCGTCQTELCCAKDVDYVFCPSCNNVTPMAAAEPEPQPKTGGRAPPPRVGLGFTLEDLRKWEEHQQAQS